MCTRSVKGPRRLPGGQSRWPADHRGGRAATRFTNLEHPTVDLTPSCRLAVESVGARKKMPPRGGRPTTLSGRAATCFAPICCMLFSSDP